MKEIKNGGVKVALNENLKGLDPFKRKEQVKINISLDNIDLMAINLICEKINRSRNDILSDIIHEVLVYLLSSSEIFENEDSKLLVASTADDIAGTNDYRYSWKLPLINVEELFDKLTHSYKFNSSGMSSGNQKNYVPYNKDRGNDCVNIESMEYRLLHDKLTEKGILDEVKR